ncbi:MAG: glycosyltransferase family 4 protein [Methylococcaceae bacterium]|nr:glycosyltransferase family 4 protein [Methylococcaceae bacterium]
MPTLLSINNYYYRRGGAEVVFLEQNSLFEEIGWQVVPFAMHHPNNLPSEWQDYFVDEIEFSADYSLLEKAARASKIIYSFEARKKIADLSEKVKPSVAHAHNVYHHISPAIFSKLKSMGIPTVLTLHDLKIACPCYKMMTHDGVCERCKGGKIWNVVVHKCVKDSRVLSSVILAETAVHRLLGSYSKDVDKFITPSKFFIEKFVARQFEPRGDVGTAFVYLGRLLFDKGLGTFIRAIALAGVKGWIVGTGPEEQQLRDLATQLNADVEFLGYKTGEAMADTIRHARAMVLPSELYENAPMSVLEAYALERPVIGADIGGIPELIHVGETGALFPSGNVEALAVELRKFSAMSDADILAMGKTGRAWAEKDFTATRYRERLLDLYRSMGVDCE